jgi:hypothetical protein
MRLSPSTIGKLADAAPFGVAVRRIAREEISA